MLYQLLIDFLMNTQNIAKKAQTVSAINNDQITPVKPNKLFKTNRTGIITVPCAIIL